MTRVEQASGKIFMTTRPPVVLSSAPPTSRSHLHLRPPHFRSQPPAAGSGCLRWSVVAWSWSHPGQRRPGRPALSCAAPAQAQVGGCFEGGIGGMGKVGRSDAGEPMTGTDRHHSASPSRSSPPRRHPLPVCAVPRRRPLPQCSATALPRRHPPSVRAVGKLPATPRSTDEAATLPFLSAPARILGELRHCPHEP